MNTEWLILVQGGDPWMHHFVVLAGSDNLRTQPALCKTRPAYRRIDGVRALWTEPPTGAVALREMCPLCLGEVANLAPRAGGT